MQRLEDPALLYAAWRGTSALLHRGWWLVTSLYLVTSAGLSPTQLILIGTAQGIVVVLAEVPAGLVADAWSRKGSLLISHALMGLGMAATGLDTDFGSLVLTQMIWGLSWTFRSGADVAWVSDELHDPTATAVALANGARWEQIGTVAGIVTFGTLAALAGPAIALITAGLSTWALGVLVAVTFKETGFSAPSIGDGVRAMRDTLVGGVRLATGSAVLLALFFSTFTVNGGFEVFGRLQVARLVDATSPIEAEPILWLSALAFLSAVLASLSLGALTRAIRTRPETASMLRIAHASAALVAAAGLALFARAEGLALALAGALVVSGIAAPLLRTTTVIWADARASSEVRATVQSLLSMAENLGEILLGISLLTLASGEAESALLLSAGLLIVVAGVFAFGHRRVVEQRQ